MRREANILAERCCERTPTEYLASRPWLLENYRYLAGSDGLLGSRALTEKRIEVIDASQ